MPNSKKTGVTPAVAKEKSALAGGRPSATPFSPAPDEPSIEALKAEGGQLVKGELAREEKKCSDFYHSEAEILVRVLAEVNQCLLSFPNGSLVGLGSAVQNIQNTIESANISEKRITELKFQLLGSIGKMAPKEWDNLRVQLSECSSAWKEAWKEFTGRVFSDKGYSTSRINSPQELHGALVAALSIRPKLLEVRYAERGAWRKIDRANVDLSTGGRIVAEHEKLGSGNKSETKHSEGTPVVPHQDLSQTSFSSDQEGRNAYAKHLIDELKLYIVLCMILGEAYLFVGSRPRQYLSDRTVA